MSNGVRDPVGASDNEYNFLQSPVLPSFQLGSKLTRGEVFALDIEEANVSRWIQFFQYPLAFGLFSVGRLGVANFDYFNSCKAAKAPEVLVLKRLIVAVLGLSDPDETKFHLKGGAAFAAA